MGLAVIGERLIPEKTRKVIKRVISSALIVALGVLQGPSQTENVYNRAISEAEANSKGKIGFIDFFSGDGKDFQDIKDIIPKLDFSEKLNTFWEVNPINRISTESIFKLSDKEQISLFRFIFYSRLTSHGNMVIHSFEQVLGAKLDRTKIPVFDMISHPSMETTTVADRLGNKGFFIKLNTTDIDKFIDSQKDTKVFNMSMQLGYLGGYYITKKEEVKDFQLPPILSGNDKKTGAESYYIGATSLKAGDVGVIEYLDDKGNILKGINKSEYETFIKNKVKENTIVKDVKDPYISFLGAFTKDNPFRVENYRILVEFAERHSDKVFVISAGNYEDVYDLGDFPSNLVIACFMTNRQIYTDKYKGMIRVPAYGDEGKGMICVDNMDPEYKLDQTGGTSNSAPIVSAFIRLEMLNGKSPLEAVESIKERSEKYKGNYVLDPGIRRAIINEIETNTVNYRNGRNERRKKRQMGRR